MIEIVKQVTQTLRLATPEAYNQHNLKNPVVYPYLTFEIMEEPMGDRNQTGVYLDIDIFDYDTSYAGAYTLSGKIMDLLTFRRDMTDELNLIYSYQGTNPIDTQDEQLKRLNMRFYIKTDRRVKVYG